MEKNKNETGIPIWLDSTVYKMKDERTDSRRTLNTAADARIMGQELLTGHANHPNCCDEPIHNQPDTWVPLPTRESKGAAAVAAAQARGGSDFDKPFAWENNSRDKSHT